MKLHPEQQDDELEMLKDGGIVLPNSVPPSLGHHVAHEDGGSAGLVGTLGGGEEVKQGAAGISPSAARALLELALDPAWNTPSVFNLIPVGTDEQGSAQGEEPHDAGGEVAGEQEDHEGGDADANAGDAQGSGVTADEGAHEGNATPPDDKTQVKALTAAVRRKIAAHACWEALKACDLEISDGVTVLASLLVSLEKLMVDTESRDDVGLQFLIEWRRITRFAADSPDKQKF
jgi:hypothetical protein